MASTSHPPFPSRPYTSGLGRNFNSAQTPYNAPAPMQQTQQQRDAQRLERERQEHAERERLAAAEQTALENLNEEQREEVNEAVSNTSSITFI